MPASGHSYFGCYQVLRSAIHIYSFIHIHRSNGSQITSASEEAFESAHSWDRW
jgi:hypothetical protein